MTMNTNTEADDRMPPARLAEILASIDRGDSWDATTVALARALSAARAQLTTIGQAVTDGAALAEMPIQLRGLGDVERAHATCAIGAAASLMRREIESNPDPETRSALSITIVYGDHGPGGWHQRFAGRRGGEDGAGA